MSAPAPCNAVHDARAALRALGLLNVGVAKFNPNHDQSDGRFTSGSRGASSARKIKAQLPTGDIHEGWEMDGHFAYHGKGGRPVVTQSYREHIEHPVELSPLAQQIQSQLTAQSQAAMDGARADRRSRLRKGIVTHHCPDVLRQLGIYKFNPNHDKADGRFTSGSGGAAGRKQSPLQEQGGGTGIETERKARAQAAVQRTLDAPGPMQGKGHDYAKRYLDDSWNGYSDDDLQRLLINPEIERSELIGTWEEMEPCKQMRRAATELVGHLPEDHNAADPFLHSEADWGGTEGMHGDLAPRQAALQLLHQLAHGGDGFDSGMGPLLRSSGVDPVELKRALKAGDTFDLPLASFAGAPNPHMEKFGTSVVFKVANPKAVVRANAMNPFYQSWDDISPEHRDMGVRPGDLAEYDEEVSYRNMDQWDSQESNNGEFITGGRFKVKSMRMGKVKNITPAGGKTLVVELEHVGVFDPWTGALV